MANELKDNERAHPGGSAKVDHGWKPSNVGRSWLVMPRHPINGKFIKGSEAELDAATQELNRWLAGK